MSTLVTNTITGLSTAANITLGSTPVVSASANSLTVRGEGSNQTSIQQGLCKCWIHLTGSGTPAAADSFNVASVTDTGTGRYTINIATDFGNANYTCAGMSGNDGTTTGDRGQVIDLTPTTGAFALRNIDTDSTNPVDDTNILLNFHGDLA